MNKEQCVFQVMGPLEELAVCRAVESALAVSTSPCAAQKLFCILLMCSPSSNGADNLHTHHLNTKKYEAEPGLKIWPNY